MAGIGWRLERLIHQGISGACVAYATGAAVMALPWVLTTAVLVSLPAVIGRGTALLATAGTVVRLGARPVLVDIDPATFNIDPGAVAAAVTARTKASRSC